MCQRNDVVPKLSVEHKWYNPHFIFSCLYIFFHFAFTESYFIPRNILYAECIAACMFLKVIGRKTRKSDLITAFSHEISHLLYILCMCDSNFGDVRFHY